MCSQLCILCINLSKKFSIRIPSRWQWLKSRQYKCTIHIDKLAKNSMKIVTHVMILLELRYGIEWWTKSHEKSINYQPYS